MKRFRFFIATLIVFALVLSLVVPVFAQTNAAISQEQAIEKVKRFFDTSKYDQFSINYHEGSQRKSWELNWSTSKEPFQGLNATVDAEHGDILNLYIYGYPDKKPSKIPKVSEEEALKQARDFASKVQPREFGKTKLVKGPDSWAEPLRFRETYYFYFMRMEKDIPVENNGFNISINAHTGNVESYDFTWSYESLPEADNIISQEEAEKIFEELKPLELGYRRFFDYKTKKSEIKLVYTISDGGNSIIDATTGEILEDKYYGIYAEDGYGMAAGDMRKEASSELSPHEQKEVEATKNCITKEQAIKAVKEYVKIPSDFTLSHSRLYESYDDSNQRIWNLSWELQDDDNYGYISAKVNALNSELMGFHISDKDRYGKDFKQNYNRVDALKKAEDFLKNIQPKRYQNVKIVESKSDSKPEKIREFYFNFVRQVNGIPFFGNGFYITVNSETGQITDYTMNWHDFHFPDVEGTLSLENAMEKLLDNVGLELFYIQHYEAEGEKPKFYLVYKLNPRNIKSPNFDAFSFKPLDYQGKPIEEKVKASFADIDGHWAQEEIQLLANLGVLSAEDDKFNPDSVITEGNFVKLLLTAHRGIENDKIQDYIDTAIRIGWAKEGELEVNRPLNREKMAALLIRSLGLEKAAAIPHTFFKISTADEAAITEIYKGHVAIGLGLKLMNPSAGNFNPKQNVTKAQAAVALVRVLSNP